MEAKEKLASLTEDIEFIELCDKEEKESMERIILCD